MTKHMNISEKYGDRVEVAIEDYKAINPNGKFFENESGIYEIVNDKAEKIAEAVETE
jgi:hypothetical protein